METNGSSGGDFPGVRKDDPPPGLTGGLLSLVGSLGRYMESLGALAGEEAREAGALGGKILGAGGGGFLLIFAPPERRRHIEKALSHFLHVPFDFEPSGSQIVLYDPEQDYEENAEWRMQNGK